MKKIYTIIIILICILSLTNPLFAGDSKNRFGLSIGQSISSPQGDFSGTGQNAGLAKAGIGYSASLD
ncbi:hypothetical protein ACFL40_03470, partial [candidate division KSB1 bacterium]